MERMRNGQAFHSMWWNWAISAAMPTLIITLSLFVDSSWLPVASFAAMMVLYGIVRSRRYSNQAACSLVPFVMSRVMFWSGLIMLVIDQVSHRGFADQWFELYNPDVPYIPVLVTAPVTVVVTLWMKLRGNNFPFCVDCRARFGTPAERGFIGRIYTQEGRAQVDFLFVRAMVLTVVCTGYYFLFYINVNLNSPDKFFFVWLPVILYLLSLVFMGTRYTSLWNYYEQELAGNNVRRPDSSTLRYLILDQERIYLTEPDNKMSPLARGLDTPATVTLQKRADVPLYEARQYFRNLQGNNDFEIRTMYRSEDAGGDSNVFHYIVNVAVASIVESGLLRGRWYTLPEVERLLNADKLAPVLAAEIHRLYTITMTWKTYDRTGRRLYKIKNYRPTFRMKNIQQWDVDFNDSHWLRVAENNQDRPFYSLRRFWRRYVNGVKE